MPSPILWTSSRAQCELVEEVKAMRNRGVAVLLAFWMAGSGAVPALDPPPVPEEAGETAPLAARTCGRREMNHHPRTGRSHVPRPVRGPIGALPYYDGLDRCRNPRCGSQVMIRCLPPPK